MEQIVPFFELFQVDNITNTAVFCDTINQKENEKKNCMKERSMMIILGFAVAIVVARCDKPRNEEADETTAEVTEPVKEKHLFMDVHNLEPGKVTFEAVADAHQKDLATQGKYDVSFIKYWVDEELGKVYCLAEAHDSLSVYNTHKEAHGLVPDMVSMVSDGEEAEIMGGKSLFLDIHYLGAGKVKAADVAKAHEKDLAEQEKHGVSFINYWVDEKLGVVTCLSEAHDADAIVSTHKAAHGLLPDRVEKVKQGQ